MHKFKFKKPYKANGKTNFPDSQGRTGVYIIRVKGKIHYVGYSSNNLYRTLYRHFQVWNENRGTPHISYNHILDCGCIKVRIIYTNTAKQAYALEKALILKYKPLDNPNKLEDHQADPQEQKYMDKMAKEYFGATEEPAPF